MHVTHSALAYRPEIDGLRAIAVLSVLFFHAGFETLGGGYLGVDVFFVISGYLITAIIARELSTGRFSIVRFYERRARRILPALFAVVACCLPFAWLLMSPQQLKSAAQSLVATVFFSSNLYFWQTSGYFDAAAELKPLLHTWSLGVEEQYYLLFPLLLMLVRGRSALLWVLALAAASLLFGWWLRSADAVGAFFLAPARAWELLAGSALALLSQQRPLHERCTPILREGLSALGLLLVVGSLFVFDEHNVFPSLPLMAPVLGAVLVIGFGVQGTQVARLLSLPPMVGVGLISYSAYLWHQPVLAFLRIRDGTGLLPWEQWLACGLSLALAYASWRWVETPFRDSQRLGQSRLFALSAAASLLAVVVGLAGHVSQGFPQRLDAASQATMASSISSDKRRVCHTEGVNYLPPDRACTYFGSRITWAALGDSHVVEPAMALAEHLKTRDEGLLHLTFSGCAPALTYESRWPGCSAWQQDAVRQLEARKDIQNVLLGFRYTAPVYGTQTRHYPQHRGEISLQIPGLSAEQSVDRYWQSMVEVVDRLLRAGKRVYVVTPIPELGSHIDSIMWRGANRGLSEMPGTSRAYYDARNALLLQRFESLPWGENLIRLDAASALCNANDCLAVQNGLALYTDDSHLSLHGARQLLAKTLISLLPPPVESPP